MTALSTLAAYVIEPPRVPLSSLAGELTLGVLAGIAVGLLVWVARHRANPQRMRASLRSATPIESARRYCRVRVRGLALLFVGAPFVLCWPGDRRFRESGLRPAGEVARTAAYPAFVVQRHHLLERLSAKAIEAREMVHDPMGAVPRLPFGHLHPVWSNFKQSVARGDELWSFDATWRGDGGQAQQFFGYVRWRHGESNGHVVTHRRDVEG